MTQPIMFGTGELWGCNSVANSTPMKFATIQDLNFDYSFTEKELRGQYQLPIDIARAAGKITGKIKTAKIDIGMYNELFFGLSMASSEQAISKEVTSVPASTPYTVTGTAGAAVLCLEDVGVLDANGGRMTKVASSPTTGQYSVAIGVSTGITYTFAAADASKAVTITYRYQPATGFNTLVLTNQVMGTTPTFSLNYAGLYKGNSVVLHLNKCTSSKFSFPLKLEDYVIHELDFSVMDDGTGVIGSISNSTTV